MTWTMPRPVLQWVASLLTLAAAASFVTGIVNAPDRGGRLPGERPAGRGGLPATAINATEATPLAQERIEAAPAPVKAANKTEAADEADTDETDTSAPAAKAVPPLKPPTVVTPQVPPPETAAPPPEDEPPH
jgi:hypothetical protein